LYNITLKRAQWKTESKYEMRMWTCN